MSTFAARWPGACAACWLPFPAGTQVVYNTANQLTHETCPDLDAPDGSTEKDGPLCQKCWCYHAGECW